MSYSLESVGRLLYPVPMAHPHLMPCPLFPKSRKDVRRIIHYDLGLPVLPFGGSSYLTSQEMGH